MRRFGIFHIISFLAESTLAFQGQWVNVKKPLRFVTAHPQARRKFFTSPWRTALRAAPGDGTELLSIEVPQSDVSDLPALSAFVEEWAAAFENPGSGLTTAVRVSRSSAEPFRMSMVFVPKLSAYADKDKADADDGWEKDKKNNKKKKEGGVEILLEADPLLRVKVVRCNMSEDTIVKEMSEETIIERLKKDIKIWIKSR